MEIANSAVIVTGAASGMGEATVRALAARGARVAAMDVARDRLEAAAKEVGALPVVCDVSSASSAESAISAARDAHGPARLLVNCAGVGVLAPLATAEGPCPLDDINRVIQINLLGTLNMLRLMAADLFHAPRLADGSRGLAICVASAGAIDGPIHATGYIASKGALVNLMLPLAREFGDLGLRVNAIAPGAVDTPMMAGVPKYMMDMISTMTPFPKRPAQPSEFASLVLHLCENVFINGETIRLDGGMRNIYQSQGAIP